MPKIWKCLFCCSWLVFLPIPLYASYGNLDIGAGEMNKGSAGVGVALPQDSFAAATNPASAAFVPTSRFDIGFTGVFPSRGYKANATSIPMAVPILPGSHDSGMPFIPTPNIGFLYHAKGSPMTYSASISGIGIATDYDKPIFGSGDAYSYYRQILTNLSASWKANDKLALGGSFIIATQSLNMEGLNGFSALSANPTRVSNKGTNFSYGAGVKVGIMAKPISRVSIGASYQPEIAMTKMNRYSGLIADDGDLNIPPTATAGIAVDVTPTLTAGFDAQYIWYSAVPAYSNRFKCSPSNLMSGTVCLGNANGSGFGWRNVAAYKIGAVWHAIPTWTFRAGYLYATEAIPSSQVLLATLAPVTIQSHFTLGLTHTIKKRFQITAMGLYAPERSVSGYNVFAPDQRIKVHLSEYEIGVALGYLFDRPHPDPNAPARVTTPNYP